MGAMSSPHTHTQRISGEPRQYIYIYISRLNTTGVILTSPYTHCRSLYLSTQTKKYLHSFSSPFSLSLSLSLPHHHHTHTHTHSLQPQSQNSINTVFIFLRTASSAINNAALAATLAPKNGIAARVNTRNAAVDDIASPLKP